MVDVQVILAGGETIRQARQQVCGNDDWLKGLTFKVKNKSGKYHRVLGGCTFTFPSLLETLDNALVMRLAMAGGRFTKILLTNLRRSRGE